MQRPPLEVADIVRVAGKKFVENSRQWIVSLRQACVVSAGGPVAASVDHLQPSFEIAAKPFLKVVFNCLTPSPVNNEIEQFMQVPD